MYTFIFVFLILPSFFSSFFLSISSFTSFLELIYLFILVLSILCYPFSFSLFLVFFIHLFLLLPFSPSLFLSFNLLIFVYFLQLSLHLILSPLHSSSSSDFLFSSYFIFTPFSSHLFFTLIFPLLLSSIFFSFPTIFFLFFTNNYLFTSLISFFSCFLPYFPYSSSPLPIIFLPFFLILFSLFFSFLLKLFSPSFFFSFFLFFSLVSAFLFLCP